MKSSDLNNSATSCIEQPKENYDDLDFLLKESTGISFREKQSNLPLEELIQAIHSMNEILKNLNLPETRNLLDDWITPQEVLQKLCISERTLSEWRKIRKIGFTRIENKFYYKKQDLENLLKKGFEKSKNAVRKQAKS